MRLQLTLSPIIAWFKICPIRHILIIIFALIIGSYFLLRRRVATAVLLRNNIYQSENVDSPFVLGLIKPTIYLPFQMDSGNLEYVIAHENAHIRRKDHWWKPLGYLLLTVYWFNPLLWVAYILLCRDIEGACDERVLRDLGQGIAEENIRGAAHYAGE